MGNLAGWKMVRRESGGDVAPGATQLSWRGEEWRVLGVTRAPGGGSTGRVLASRPWVGKPPAWTFSDQQQEECYPSVFGLEIVEDVPQDDPYLVTVNVGHGLQGLDDMLHSAMNDVHDPLVQSMRTAIATAYALGYYEALEGMPSAIPSTVVKIDPSTD